MIVITGAEGFIGSCLVAKLNQHNYNDLVLVDDFDTWPERSKNLAKKIYTSKINRKNFFSWLKKNANQVQFIFHIGARTDTTETNEAIFKELINNGANGAFSNSGVNLTWLDTTILGQTNTIAVGTTTNVVNNTGNNSSRFNTGGANGIMTGGTSTGVCVTVGGECYVNGAVRLNDSNPTVV